jgi:hypothetical protein
VLLFAALIGLSGCDLVQTVASNPPPPKQVVLASTQAAGISQGVVVGTYSIPSGVQNFGIDSSVVIPDGGILVTERARPFTPPAIAANDSIFVAYYWGGQPGFNHARVFTSESARFQSWTRPVWNPPGSDFLAASSDIDDNARPSLTFFPATGTWFFAYRSANTGTILVYQLLIRDTGNFDSRGGRIFQVRPITQMDTGVATPRPPALSFIGTSLVLAFIGQGGVVNVTTPSNSPAGSDPFNSPFMPTFKPAAAATTTVRAAQARNSTSVLSDGGAPYLHNILDNIYLATARSAQQGGVDVHVLQSGDGATWNTEVFNFHATADAPVDPSIAGPVSQMVVAYRGAAATGTTVNINGGGTVTLDTQTDRSVAGTYGPGPSVAERLTCAEPNLVARTSNGDVPIPISAGGGTVPMEVSNSGNLTLLCGANATIDAGCPANTTLVTIKRGPQPAFALECWPK